MEFRVCIRKMNGEMWVQRATVTTKTYNELLENLGVEEKELKNDIQNVIFHRGKRDLSNTCEISMKINIRSAEVID